MKKFYTICLLMLVWAYSANSQTNLYSINFDSYTAGSKFVQQAGNPWTTWSNAPGGTEDPVVSTTQAHSPANSVYVVNNNDLVLKLNGKTSGRYEVGWYMYVESAKLGYFNFLSNFSGSNSYWALQVEIYNDSLYVDANGPSTAKIPFALGRWSHMQLIVDLDDDFATYFVDSTEVVSYQWSKGAQGTDTIKKLDGIDFYGWDGTGSSVTGTSGYYIDDLTVDSIQAPSSPLNLTAVLNSANVDVTWTAPTTPPVIYKLSRNGTVVDATNSLNYTDLSPWPNTYIYGVRAYYGGLGYSHSNSDTLIVPGGVARNLVLFEEGTSMYCQYCPGAAMGLRDLIDVNHKNAVAIAYHPTSGGFEDTYGITAANDRLNYYAVDAYPTVVSDGIIKAVGGNATTSLYTTYLPMYNERFATPSLQILNMNITQVAVDSFAAKIIVQETYAYATGWHLMTALTETNIAQVWENQTVLDFVCRGMYPSSTGTALSFATQTTDTVNLNFSTAGFVKNNCKFIAFMQHQATKEVTQCMCIDMSSILGINELQGKNISIYPNPATDYIMTLTSGKGNLYIYDITGKLVKSTVIFNPTQVIDVSNLTKGVYIVKMSTPEKNFTEKLVIQ